MAIRLAVLFASTVSCFAATQPFLFPTENHSLLKKGGEESFFVGTTGKPWTSGMFGCVRSEGRQMHEGIDIRCLRRDKHGEPADAVNAVADGEVAYINTQAGLSNYGNYVVIRHQADGMEIYSLYAHLKSFRQGLRVGEKVKAGDPVATMGRTANTREGISRDRAHVHLEFNFLLNERFAEWHTHALPDQRNDHGMWNGQNLVGLDPSTILKKSYAQKDHFSLLDLVRDQEELFRVRVNRTGFSWAKRYPMLVQGARGKGDVAGYDICFNFNGVPFQLIPRKASDLQGINGFGLVSVHEKEAGKHSCRRLVVQKNGRWELGENGRKLIDLLLY